MKVYGKWLVMGRVERKDTPRIASSFMTKKDAIEALDRAFLKNGKKLNSNLWEDSMGQQFYIEKNTKEWR